MAVIIFAGGMSSRMGRDKALLDVGGASLLQSLADRFAGVSGEAIVVARPEQQLAVEGVRLVHDIYRDSGPLAGLHAGLSASCDDANFALACDMPFADLSLARHLLALLPGYDAVVPMLGRGPEPLFAAYGKSAVPEVVASLDAGRFRMRDTLDRLNVLHVLEDELRKHDPDLRSFRNINTPEDYAALAGW